MSVDESWQARRATLARICNQVGFPSPQSDAGLSRWADEALDTALAPRGGPDWAEGHSHTIRALEAILLGDEGGCRAMLKDALAVVARSGRRRCACPDRGYVYPNDGRALCVRCLGRVR